MDALSKFLIDSFGTSKTASKTREVVPPPLTVFEKWAYGNVLAASSMDESWLSQFEGTPLAPQAIALAEQELAMEQRQLQQRMQRNAERQNDNYEQNSIEQDGLRLQKQQLVLELYKQKAMTPTPKPGDAVIGQPLPQPAAPEMGMGPEGGAPVEEPMPGKMAAYRDDAAMRSDAQTSWEGMGRGSRALHHGVHGAMGGGILGALGGAGLSAATHTPGVVGSATALGALGGGALGAMRGATSARPTMGIKGLGFDNVHRSATDRVEKRKAKEESDAAKAETKKKANHPHDMPMSGAKWDHNTFEDFLLHGDDPRIPTVARKAVLQAHINSNMNAPLHSPEEALSEAQSQGKWTGGTLGALGGVTLGGLIGMLAHHEGGLPGMAIGGIGGGVLGAMAGKKHWGTPEHAGKNVESAKAYQAYMKSLHGDDAGQERVLGDLMGDRLKSKESNLIEQAASSGWRQRVAPVKDFARTVAAGAKTSSFVDEMLATLPKRA